MLPQDAAGEYVKYALAPLSEICVAAGNSGEFHALMECGNKLKIFHTIECLEKPEGEFSFDNLLYGGGTLSVFKPGAPMGFSDEYYKSILSGNKLSIFNNWKALALLDTFTIVIYETKDHLLELWNKEYFEKLYLHSLFRKFFLFFIGTGNISEGGLFLFVHLLFILGFTKSHRLIIHRLSLLDHKGEENNKC